MLTEMKPINLKMILRNSDWRKTKKLMTSKTSIGKTFKQRSLIVRNRGSQLQSVIENNSRRQKPKEHNRRKILSTSPSKWKASDTNMRTKSICNKPKLNVRKAICTRKLNKSYLRSRNCIAARISKTNWPCQALEKKRLTQREASFKKNMRMPRIISFSWKRKCIVQIEPPWRSSNS